MNSALITGMVFFFNAGNTFTGTVSIDDIQLGDPIPFTPGKILINQVGYELNGPKKAIFQLENSTLPADSFYLITHPGNTVVFKEKLGIVKNVTGWTGRFFSEMDFSSFNQTGTYKLKIGGNISYPFKIEFNLLFKETAEKVVQFFKGMRNTMAVDLNLSFNGPRNDAVNVYGGWSDATGDPGKHMSHLSYANFFNPQQIPMVSWSMMKAYELYPDGYASFETALKEEVAWGTDYIVRNVDPAGYMYLSIFDDWGGAPSTREITEWGQEPACDYCRTPNYQAAMREGTGIAIAALARAHSTNISGTLSSQYLNSAITLYNHLKQPGTGYATKNLEYCNNHEENLLDYYCGLLAATELYKATQTPVFLADAQIYVDLILSLQHEEGWLYSNNAKTRPFFHAADEGLPILALEEFSSISNYKLPEISLFMNKWFEWYKNISTEITNPFDYVRQYGRPFAAGTMGTARKAFFVPQANETGYWWQGENARISSMIPCLHMTTASNIVRKLYYRFSKRNAVVAPNKHATSLHPSE
ncbi:MAG: glycoside hydrolase family 9 protein [Cytophagales bacterium]